jgi:hypothetical protein
MRVISLLVASTLAACGASATPAGPADAQVTPRDAGVADARAVAKDSGDAHADAARVPDAIASSPDAPTGTPNDASRAPAPWTSPSAEICGDGIDNNANGLVDEDCPPSLFAGVFPPNGGDDLGSGTGSHVRKMEADLGRPLSVLQTYRGTSPASQQAIGPDVAQIFAHGAAAHLNIEPGGYQPSQYAAASTDPQIASDLAGTGAAIAAALAAAPGSRMLLTFGAEMNGSWTDWGCLAPATYIAFYREMHDVTVAALAKATPPVDPRRLRWVFGPDSDGSCRSPDVYFPGYGYVDYLGMSAYRTAVSQTATDAVVTPAQALFTALSFPDDWQQSRFIVLQTGTGVYAGDDRGAWLSDLYTSTLGSPIFHGLLYFDQDDTGGVAWSLLTGDTPPAPQPGYPEWVSAVDALPRVSANLASTFEPYFWDVRVDTPRYAEVQSFRAAGLTNGCSAPPASPPLFCPVDPLTRRAAAIFLVGAFGLPTASGPAFSDVPASDPGKAAIETVAALGALPGCTATTFCPADAIARVDLATALAALRKPPPSTSAPPFSDLAGLPSATVAALGALAQYQWIDGCGSGKFCPADQAARADAVAWIVHTANLPPAPPIP